MVTRREVLQVGLTLTSVLSSTTFLSSVCQAGAGNNPSKATPIDALLVDENLGISNHFAALICSNGRHLPIIRVRLDPLTPVDLKRAFDRFRAIAGISSGATLFCLERIAWDHGFRITRRSEQGFGNTAGQVGEAGAAVRALQRAIILDRAEDFAAATLPIGRAYRPSRADETLHAWIMQTTAARNSRGQRQGI